MSQEESELHNEPPAGTPLKCALLGGCLKELAHSGVYLGKGQVAELTGDGEALAVSLSDFLNGNGGEFAPALRTGFRIYAACDAGSGKPLGTEKVAKVARDMTVGSQVQVSIEYNLFKANCHKFTAFCIGFPYILKDGVSFLDGSWMIDRLEHVIEQILNQGRGMEWLPVSPDTPGFHYGATAGKYIQAGAAKAAEAAVGVAVGMAAYDIAARALQKALDDDWV